MTALSKWMIGFLIASVALVILHQHYQLSINLTPSLPYKIFLINKNEQPRRGQLIAFKWKGGLGYAPGVTMIKKVIAQGGDVIQRRGYDFYIDLDYFVHVNPQILQQKKLDLAASGIVKPDQYFVLATHPTSLDSRYRQFGNVQQHEVIGRAYPIW